MGYYLLTKYKMRKSPVRGKAGASGRRGKSDKPKFDPRHFERPGVSLDEIDEIMEAFDMFDKDGSGSIEPKELMDAMKKLGFEHDNEIVYQMIADSDNDNKLILNEEIIYNYIDNQFLKIKKRLDLLE